LASFVYAYAGVLKGSTAAGAIYELRRLRYLQRVVALVAVAPAAFGLLLSRRRADALADRLALAALLVAGVMAQPLAWVSYYVVTAFAYLAALFALRPGTGGAAGRRGVAAVLVGLAAAGHALTAGNLWGAAARRLLFHYKCVVWAALFLYAGVVVIIFTRRRRAGAPGG